MIKVIISGDYTLTDIPYMDNLINRGSSGDVPIFMFVLFVVLVLLIVFIIVILGYCRFIKKVSLCKDCW